MPTYDFGGHLHDAGDAQFPAAAAAAHGTLPRPRCMCRPEGVQMYVARLGELFLVKRMPDSGAEHAPDCASYQPPAELSGLGAVMDGAIQTDVATGIVSLRLGFRLSQKSAGPARTVTGASTQSTHASSDGVRLGLRATLHYLWNEAGFHRWSPAMEGKRNWFVIRKYLLEAAQDKPVDGRPLCDSIYIPETFSLDAKEALARGRLACFANFAQAGRTRRLLLFLGEVKEIAQARFGRKLTLKHVPDAGFMLRDDIARRVETRFGAELALWNAQERLHLVAFGTASVGANGIASAEEMTLMLTTERWIPVEDQHDIALVEQLVLDKRRFDKGLRFNLLSEQPRACAVLTDTPEPTALYVLRSDVEPAYADAMRRLQDGSSLASLTWTGAPDPLPPLPPVQGAAAVRPSIK